jgi:hypothetical protein
MTRGRRGVTRLRQGRAVRHVAIDAFGGQARHQRATMPVDPAASRRGRHEPADAAWVVPGPTRPVTREVLGRPPVDRANVSRLPGSAGCRAERTRSSVASRPVAQPSTSYEGAVGRGCAGRLRSPGAGEDVEPASAGGQSARVDDTDPSSDIVDAEGSTPSDGELLTEAVEEEPEEEVVEEITVPALRSTSVAQARSALLAGAVVTLVVAAPMPRVPGVLGQGAATGKAALMRAGFKVNIVKETVSSGANDVVLRQTPTGRSTSLGQTPTTSTAMATEWPASPDTDEGSSSGRVPPPRVRSPLDRANCLRWWSVTDRGRPLG